jgi:predicted NBD/HSP70 family sugar kinase
MYVGVDIGGTKTLAGVLDKDGVIIEKSKFPTSKDYSEFVQQLSEEVSKFSNKDFSAGAVAVTGPSTDREHGIIINSSNLPWRNAPIQRDAEAIFKCPIVIENDAKLAALSEAMLLKDKYRVVLYVTVSTGIGYGLCVDQKIDTSIGDGGGRTILLEHDGKLQPWEDFASGHAIVEKYGKPAKDIEDVEIWKTVSRDLAKGFIELIAIMQPEVIVIGGGVGNYFNKFHKFLEQDINMAKIPLIKMPVLMEAQRPDEAVLFGCYDLAEQVYPNAANN